MLSPFIEKSVCEAGGIGKKVVLSAIEKGGKSYNKKNAIFHNL